LEGQTRVIHDCRSYRRKNTAVENAPATRAIKLYETASRSRWRLKSRQQIALDILQVESLVRQVGGEEACSPLEPAIERGPRVLEAHLHTSMQAHQRSSAILRGPQRYLKGHLQSGMQAYSRHTWPSVAIKVAISGHQVESLVRQVGGEEACSPLEPAIERGPRVLEAHLHTSMQAHQRSSAILRGPQRYLKGYLQSGMQAYSRHTWPSVAIKVAISGHQWQSVAIRCGFTGYQMHVQTRGVPGARIPHRHSGATPAPQYRRPKRVPNPPSLRLI
jgi:hypothetical protein